MDPGADPIRRRRRRRRALTLVALLLGLTLPEWILRWLLFSDAGFARELGARFRDPSFFAYDTASEEYPALEYLLAPPERRWHAGHPHAVLGWVPEPIDPVSLRHADAERVGARRPVLLYGTSFAHCVHGGACFEELLERSEAGRRFALLNHAAAGYGLDQALLLLERTLDAYADRDPVVVIAFVPEVDLDRCTTSFFTAPKPRYVPTVDGFELVAPDELDPERFLARHPPATSYLLRYLVYGVHVLPDSVARSLAGEDERIEGRRRLWKYLLSRAQQTLERRGVAHFLLLFHPEGAAAGQSIHPEEPLLVSFLEELGLPYVDSDVELAQALHAGTSIDELYLHDPSGHGHPNERGTELLFGALLRGIEGRFDQRPVPRR